MTYRYQLLAQCCYLGRLFFDSANIGERIRACVFGDVPAMAGRHFRLLLSTPRSPHRVRGEQS